MALGWEWAGWVSDVVTARSAWDPKLESHPGSSATEEETAFAAALEPIARPFGEAAAPRITEILTAYVVAQHRLLVRGDAGDGEGPPKAADIGKLTGIAYLAGIDPWTELTKDILGTMTQPDKVPHTRPTGQSTLC